MMCVLEVGVCGCVCACMCVGARVCERGCVGGVSVCEGCAA